MQRVSIHEAKTHLSRLIKQIEGGESIIITNNGKPVASLGAPPKAKRRILGDLAEWGKKHPLPDDVNDPMPDEWFFPDPDKFNHLLP